MRHRRALPVTAGSMDCGDRSACGIVAAIPLPLRRVEICIRNIRGVIGEMRQGYIFSSLPCPVLYKAGGVMRRMYEYLSRISCKKPSRRAVRARIGICRPAAYPLPQRTSHPHCLRRFFHARAVTGRKYHDWRVGIGRRDCLVPPCGMDMDRSPFSRSLLRSKAANQGVLAYLPLCLCAGTFRGL